MNKEQYFKFHRECCDRMIEITKNKNADYTGVGDDPFANFTRTESGGIATTEQGFLVRMSDKMSRLASFAQKGSYAVKDESFEDTCLDLANYAILLAGYMRSKKEGVPVEPKGFAPLPSPPGEPMTIIQLNRKRAEAGLLPVDVVGETIEHGSPSGA